MPDFQPPVSVTEVQRRPDAPAGRRGFTLIEILVTVSIMVLIMGLIITWIASAYRGARVRTTHMAMGNTLAVADVLKNNSAIVPDHRLANFFWIQPHTAAAGVTPTWSGGSARQMSSAEFIAFLASRVERTDGMLGTQGKDYLKASPVPASWGFGPSPPPEGILVDVFEQDPGNPFALDKNSTSTTYGLMSPAAGYRLKSLFDGWGSELVYRYFTDKTELNQADGDLALSPSGVLKIRENIVRDESSTTARYATMGLTTSSGVEYVRPAVPAYNFPHLMSAGPDRAWGRLLDPERDILHGGRQTRDQEAADNIYSMELNR